MTRSRWCSASRERLPRPTTAPTAVQALATWAARRMFGNIVGGAVIRLIGAVLLEANDEWALQNRYMQTEAMAELTPPLIDAVPAHISTVAA